ncbi:MAG: hypothetical protein WC699_03275 [Bacteroidales bacterium]
MSLVFEALKVDHFQGNEYSFLRQGNNDFIGLDGVYYFAVAANPTEWLSLRFSKHHICTHIGDEFPRRITTSVTDRDPMFKQGPTMDDFRWAVSVRPLWFLDRPNLDIMRVYAEVGYFDPGGDFLGLRWIGGVFAAGNVSAYQQNGFGKNINITAGWIVPQERNKLRLRFGVQFYNGRSLVNEFYNRKEKFISAFMAFDV